MSEYVPFVLSSLELNEVEHSLQLAGGGATAPERIYRQYRHSQGTLAHESSR